MPQVCPTCHTALDPTHAPVARVRAARVVTYCSTLCAQNAESGSAQVVADEPLPGTQVKRQPVKAKPVKAKPVPAARVEPPAPKRRLPSPESEIYASDDEILAPVPEARESKMSSSLRTRVLWASSVIMLGGMAVAIIQAVSPSTPSPANAADGSLARTTAEGTSDSSTSPGATKSAADQALSPKALRTSAIVELEGHLKTGSSRFQRLAGIALGRIAHPGSIATLTKLLESEPSDLSRVDIAYGLARAGQEKGRAHLIEELESKRRDVRIDAARRLVELGDDTGRKALVQMLGIRSHRLGAAIVLALLGDEQGLSVLHATLVDKSGTDENKMRAAVGLGRAGDPSAQELLYKILDDQRYVVDAAGALAALKDDRAIVALERQLELTALRVGAAESIHSMGHKVDFLRLTSALATGNPESRIAAAEAILVLTAPAKGKSGD